MRSFLRAISLWPVIAWLTHCWQVAYAFRFSAGCFRPQESSLDSGVRWVPAPSVSVVAAHCIWCSCSFRAPIWGGCSCIAISWAARSSFWSSPPRSSKPCSCWPTPSTLSSTGPQYSASKHSHSPPSTSRSRRPPQHSSTYEVHRLRI